MGDRVESGADRQQAEDRVPDGQSMRISDEAIYQSLFVQSRGALGRELVACLRTGRALRVPRPRTQGRGKGFVTDELLVSQRPPRRHPKDRRGRARGYRRYGPPSGRASATTATRHELKPQRLSHRYGSLTDNPVLRRAVEFGSSSA